MAIGTPSDAPGDAPPTAVATAPSDGPVDDGDPARTDPDDGARSRAGAADEVARRDGPGRRALSAAVEDDPVALRRLARRTQLTMSLWAGLTNVIGAVTVFVFAAWVLPANPLPDEHHVLVINVVLVSIWIPVAITFGILRGRRLLRPTRTWLEEGRAPTDEEEIAVLHAPMALFRLHLTLWWMSAGAFALVNGFLHPRLISRVGLPVVLGGLTTSAIAYLTVERVLRPVTARALAWGRLDRPRLPGVAARQILAWALGTGVPVLGLAITGIVGLADPDTSVTSLAVTMISLGAVALIVGLWATVLGARAVSDPIRTVRHGLARVAEGDLDVEIPVYDGSEIGLLQNGFNQMVAGLRERERIRDLFGRHVGTDVAAEAIDDDAGRLGGETRTVAVLFVDIVASTRLAAENQPEVVVDVLNRFFDVVVSTVDAHHGWINKFQGDAALAIFGAPVALDDPPRCALAAARALAERLRDEVPDCRAGIGVSYGTVVAGNIGAEARFEYTVIGDPVNEAARLTEASKEVDGGVLASGRAVAAADVEESRRWVAVDSVTLRGRTTPTALHAPR